MYSVNSRIFLLCNGRGQLIKRLAKIQPFDHICLRFLTCSVERFKKRDRDSTLFTPVKIEPCTDSLNVGEELSKKLNKAGIIRAINAFCRTPEVKKLSEDTGLDEVICQKGFQSFRKFCVESATLPPDLHIVLHDVIENIGKPIDLFPYFISHVKKMYPHLECMEDLKKIGDISEPATWYPLARNLKRKFYLHCGPTNSGKTYQALQCFYNSESGIYCAPLKLLAVEVHQKANAKGTSCDLITGEDVIFVNPTGEPSKHISCTIEMCSLDKTFDVAIIDEIQMLRDNQRGWAWTRALLGIQAKEIHLCGEEAALDIVDSILCTTNEEIEVKKYKRLTKLKLDQPLESLSNIQPGDCIVCFNKNDIYHVTNSLEALGHKASIVYGSLPPHTKLAHCEKFNNPNDPCKVLVATDAVGMGLNLNIRRIVFYSLIKLVVNELGQSEKTIISVSQALQIAGRAGRHGSEYTEGFVTTFRKSEFKILENLLSQKPDPISAAGLLPTLDQIEMFSYYLPKSSFSELVNILIALATVDSSTYFMCDLKDFLFLAEMIENVPLPLKVRYTFCCAPVNKKSHFVCVMFMKFAKKFSLNETVTATWVCNKIGWPSQKPKNYRELTVLETSHEVLELYLWLSNRFEEYFPHADVIKKLEKEIDMVIYETFAKLSMKYHEETELKKLNAEANAENV